MIDRLCLALFVSSAYLAFAGCGGGTTLTPGPVPTAAPDAAAQTPPFLPLTFNVEVIGQAITNGWQCPTGILTSSALQPSSRARRTYGVRVATGGCDANGFPIPSPLPTPPAPTPAPLVTVTTQQIVAPALTIRLPSILGWTSTLTFPSCAAGSCDAGTANGSIALDALQGPSATTYGFALVFRNTGPENLSPPPSVSDHPGPHIWNLYGPPVAPGAPLQPVPVYVSGAPVTLGFPTVSVTKPVGATLDPRGLRLSIVQKLTPPTYEEAIFTDDFLTIPLVDTSPAYAPSAATASSATFTLPSTPFPFQTDFTEYDFTLVTS